jgi:hypothetical protein
MDVPHRHQTLNGFSFLFRIGEHNWWIVLWIVL